MRGCSLVLRIHGLLSLPRVARVLLLLLAVKEVEPAGSQQKYDDHRRGQGAYIARAGCGLRGERALVLL